jgi:hypothetical protein
MTLHIAVVQPERELTHISAKVLRAGVMINAMKAAF